MTVLEEFPDFPIKGNAVTAEPWSDDQDAAFKAWLSKDYWNGPRWFKVRFNFELACRAMNELPTFNYYVKIKKTRFLRLGNIYDYEGTLAEVGA